MATEPKSHPNRPEKAFRDPKIFGKERIYQGITCRKRSFCKTMTLELLSVGSVLDGGGFNQSIPTVL